MAVGPLALLQTILPEAVICAIDFDGDLGRSPPTDIFAAQAERRRAEQQSADMCVERLLSALGHPGAGAVHGRGGERLWPDGIVGSLTHKGTIVLGAAARTRTFLALGIDLETWSPDDLDLADVVASEGLPSLSPTALAATLVFSAKEALFKAQFPLTGRRLEFEDVDLSWGAATDVPPRMTASCRALPGFTVRAVVQGRDIVCAALSAP